MLSLLQNATVENRKLKSSLENIQSHQRQQTDVINAPQNDTVPTNPQLDNIDLLTTDHLSDKIQHQPIAQWFARRNIKPIFDYQAVNTQGYFDEAAFDIGQNYDVFRDILGKIAWAYNKKHNGIKLDLSKNSQIQTGIITSICRNFYEHTLFSNYIYHKQNKILNLGLQPATPIRQFFLGGWLEWFALSQILHHLQSLKHKPQFACARNTVIEFMNGDKHELDVLVLTKDNELFVIECKSGEYRKEINKYLDLKRRMQVADDKFYILVTDISASQAQSMSAMYGINFVTLDKFGGLVKAIFM